MSLTSRENGPLELPGTSPGVHLSLTFPGGGPILASIKKFNRTDVGNSRLIAHHHRDHLRYDHLRHQWLIWTGHRWQFDTGSRVNEIAKATLRRRYLDAYHIYTGEEAAKEARWAATSESSSRIEAALHLAQSEPLLADNGRSWDSDPTLLGVSNGVLNLTNGKLRPGSPKDRITFQAGASYDPNATCPTWLTFLKTTFLDDDLINFVQRAVGYCLTGATTEQCLFLCYGTGANGKSTFLSALHSLLGDYSYNLPFSAFEQNARSSISNDIAALPGRRFVIANETNESVRLNEARIKALTGGDVITCRKLYAENFEFKPVCKPWLAFNHKPFVRDDSHGFWRRVRLIPFTQTFDISSADPTLQNKLQGEIYGILNWALDGCRLWQKVGLEAPATIKAATLAYQKESDPINDFFTDRVVIEGSAIVSSTELWGAYCDWIAENKERYPLTRLEFSRRLEERGFISSRLSGGASGGNRTRIWKGLRLCNGPSFLEANRDTEGREGGVLQ